MSESLGPRLPHDLSWDSYLCTYRHQQGSHGSYNYYSPPCFNSGSEFMSVTLQLLTCYAKCVTFWKQLWQSHVQVESIGGVIEIQTATTN